MSFFSFGKKKLAPAKVDLSNLQKILTEIELINKKSMQARSILATIRKERNSILKGLISTYRLDQYMAMSRGSQEFITIQTPRLVDLIHREQEMLNIFNQSVPRTLEIIATMKLTCRDLGLGETIMNKITPLEDLFNLINPTLKDSNTRLSQIASSLKELTKNHLEAFTQIKELLAQEDAQRNKILTHFKPGLIKESKEFFDRMMFFVQQHKQEELALLLGISVTALLLAFAPDIASATRPVTDFLNHPVEINPSTWSDQVWHGIYTLTMCLGLAIGVGTELWRANSDAAQSAQDRNAS